MMITWKLEKRLLTDLKDHPRNPRKMSKTDAEQLKKSIQKYGIIDKLVITTDNLIIGGHQRKRIFRSLGIKEVDCWVPSRPLEEAEVDELNIRLNKNNGAWDFDILANSWELNDLVDWGFDPSEFGVNADETVDSSDDEDEKSKLVTINLTIPDEDCASFENQLDDLLTKFPRVAAKKK